MPDFDKFLNPIIKDTQLPSINVDVREAKRYAPLQFPDENLTAGTPPNNLDLESKASIFANMPAPKQRGQSVSLAELDANKRYEAYNPLLENNEDFAAYGQGWSSKMVNGVGKGLLLTGTTFLQGTIGLVNGLVEWGKDGKFSSFYNNDFNRALDELNKKAEDYLPNYYSNIEKNANWYSPDYFMTGNFLWDGVVKNMGFAAGAYLTGGVYSAGLKGLANLPGAARLLSMGKAAEAVAASEEALIGVDKGTEAYGKIKALSNSYLSKYNILDKGHRAVVAGLSTSGEAGFEAYQNLNDFRTKKIEEYKSVHGVDPTGAELDKINRMADSVGNSSFLANVALLSATNYIQFPKILGSSYTAEKGIINNVTREMGEVTVDAAGKLSAKVGKNKLLNLVNKIRPYTFSTSEAFEEGAQYAIQTGTQDYYNKKYNNQATDWLDGIYAGISETLGTNEGAKNILIGGLSGAIMMGRSTYLEGKQEAKNTSEGISQINKFALSDFTKETISSLNRGTVLQEEREKLLKEGNITESKDKETDYIINYLTPRIKFGRFDLVKADIEDYKRLASTDEGFNELVKEGKALATDTRPAYLERLNRFEQTANDVKSLYQSLSLRYGGMVNEKGNPIYSSAVIDKLIYASTKVSDYDKRIPQLSLKLLSPSFSIEEVVDGIRKDNFEPYAKAVAAIEADDTIDDDKKEDLLQALDDVGFMTIKRDVFLKEYNDIKKNPDKYQEVMKDVTTDLTPTTPGEKKETISIKTKLGDRDIEVDTEYFLGKVIEYDKKGRPINRAPIVKVLGEEDGKIKIQDVKTGVITLVNPEAIEDFKLGKVSDATKKDLWINENWNTIFQHRGRKDKSGKFLEGRIENHPKEGMMYFVYTDEKGKVRKIPVKNEMFVAREGYKRGLIAPKEKLVSKKQQTLEEVFSAKERAAQSVRDQAMQARAEVISETYEETLARIEDTKKELDKNATAIEKVEKQLAEEYAKIPTTKKGTPSKRVSKVLRQSIDALTKTLETLQDTQNSLEEEKENLEASIPYLESFIDELKDGPEDNNEFIDQLTKDISLLKDLSKITSDTISKVEKLFKDATAVLNTALKEFNKFIEDLKSKNPTIPVFVEELQDRIEKVMGPEAAKLIIEDKLGFTTQVMALEDQINDLEGVLELPQLNKSADELRQELDDLRKGLMAFKGEQTAKEIILEKFKSYIKQQEQLKAEEEKVAKSRQIQRDLLGTEDSDAVQNREFDAKYEPDDKKPITLIPEATITTGDKPHAVRSNKFGANLNSFDNRDEIRGVHITSKNEGELIPGLTDHLRKDDDDVVDQAIDKDKIIALVMINAEGKLVDVDGKEIEPRTTEETIEQYNQRVLDSAVYQVMPLEKLQWGPKYDNQSMFRVGVSEEYKDQVRTKYAAWRNTVLERTDIGPFRMVDASFGRPEMVEKIINEKGDRAVDYDAKTAVVDAGLVTEDDISSTPLIYIPKTNATASKGSVSFTDAIGQLFLEVKNAYVKLQNRRHSDKEAKVIFDSLVMLSKYMMDRSKGLKSDEAVRILTYLKSSVYWGTPETQQKVRKNAGYNSIFFERDETTGRMMLSISGKGKDFVFTPSSLLENEETILSMLEGMYKNVNSNMVQNLNESYEEITKIGENGEVTSTIWPNYQTYLLSNKNVDGSPRVEQELPVSTLIRPLVGENDVNRKNIYFYTTDNADDFTATVPATKQAAQAKPVITPGMPKASEVAATAKPSETPETKTSNKEGIQVLEANIEARRTEELSKATTDAQKEEINNKYDEIKAKLDNVTVAKPGQFVLDGKTLNIQVGNTGMIIVFTSEKGITVENTNEKIKIMPEFGDTFSVVEYVKEKGNMSQPDAIANIKKSLANAVVEYEATSKEFEQYDEFSSDEFEPYVEPMFEQPVQEAIDQASKMAGKPISQSVKAAINAKRNPSSRKARREILIEDLKKLKKEDWSKVEKWVKAVLPNIPVYRVKNVIQATNGKQSWGMFHDGAIYIYENAQVGTTYHEVFHAIWRMFTDAKEQEAILNEFKSRKGQFFDRTSQKNINYADATEDQIEEALAEEFRDYVHEGKIPKKPASGKPFILKMFSDLINWIKKIFLSKNSSSLVEGLFKNINQGSYKANLPYTHELSLANVGIQDIENAEGDETSANSLIDMSDLSKHDILQEMTYKTLLNLVDNDKDLFSIPSLTKGEVYDGLYEHTQLLIKEGIDAAKDLMEDPNYQTPELQQALINDIADTTLLMQQVEDNWEALVERHQEYLRGYSITFDENDEMALTDDEKSKEDPYGDATKIDHFKKSNAAIKLLLSTIPVLDDKGDILQSSIGGAILMPTSQTYISVMNNIHDATDMEDMLEKLRQMALNDETYAVLYDRLTKSSHNVPGLDLSNIKSTQGARLLDAFWKTFKKQNPVVKNVFILNNGDIVVGDASLSTAASQLRAEYLNSIIVKAKEGKGFFTYNKDKKVYQADKDKVRSQAVNNLPQMIAFLDKLGVDFKQRDLGKLKNDQISLFKDVVYGIKDSILATQDISSFSSKVLDMEKRLFQLGLLKAAIDNPEFDSTYFNVSGERTQSFVGTNAASNLFSFLNSLEKFTKDSLAGTNYSYLGSDVFTEGSSILSRKYTKDGTIIKGAEDLMSVGFVGGVVNEVNGKSKPSAKLDYKNRLIQELNLNLKGWYLNLIPGDASLEWMIKMGNPISAASLTRGFGEVHKLFQGYFISELKLAREGRPIANVKGRSTNDMRFFKAILGEELHNTIVSSTESEEKVYEDNAEKINKAIDDYITNKRESFKETLSRYGILKPEGYGYTMENIDLPNSMVESELNRHLNMLTVNYFVAQIEMHKLLYSDPYQYSDQLKRIKNFNSSGQAIVNNSSKMNKLYNTVWNKGFKRGSIGYTNFSQEYFRTATHTDVDGIVDLPNYEVYTETDGQGIISFVAHRNFRIRASDWNESEERQFRYDIAWEKRDKGLELTKAEQEILDLGNPEVRSAYTPSKPIVRGNKANGKNYNDVVLDKFALYPLSYRLMKQINPTSNAVKLYDKMQKEKIDYIVFNSARKVGADKAHLTYNENGEFNNTSYEKRAIINIPLSIMDVQTEVPSKDTELVTRGSQVTKLITMDFMDAGVPIDFELKDSEGNVITNFTQRYSAWYGLTEDQKMESELYREIKTNQDLLNALMKAGYNSLLRSLGISDKNGKITISNYSAAAKTLRNEILKREVNDNISDALKSFLNGEAILEATPAYQQIRNILYSIADREIISPKTTGGMKVQVASTLLESVRAKKTNINGKEGFTSDYLEFYKKEGKRVCEVMVARWFDSPLSDEELLKYLNTTEEGKRILSGLAFRIPTQKQNSIDSFVIKQFLPNEFGDSVIVPAAIVAKTGSDFDIDKLSMYFKNVKVNKEGYPVYVEYLDDNNSTATERFIKYVSKSTKDFRDIVKDFKNSQEYQTKGEKISNRFEKVSEEREALKGIKQDIDDSYNAGYIPFSQLPLAMKQIFWKQEEDLNADGVDGIQKNIYYTAIANKLITTLKKEKSIVLDQTIQLQDGKTKVESVTIQKDEALPLLQAMVANYKEMNTLYGMSEEQQNKLQTVLEGAKNYKELLNEQYKLEVAKVIAESTNLDSLEEFSARNMDDQNTKEALENAYNESAQRLVSHPRNYDRLIQPNSADQLKGISKFIAEKTTGQSFDYTNVGNMLDRTFMSSLRHAFVSGKYAIGIAAVNQTNHSLNQRQVIYIDRDRLKNVSEDDRFWLGNARVNFPKFNELAVGSYMSPVFSMVKNAERSEKYPEGQDISDILAQFIDGYVDISKGPWIMEMGATPNVASTWMTLVKMGVPIETVAYFMNQPIIRDYLQTIENAGYSYLFIDSFMDDMMDKYAPKGQKISGEDFKNLKDNFTIPDTYTLKDLVGKTTEDLNTQQLRQQQLMLWEFVKYAKMAEHMFLVTQGSNFDTANFNDPYLVFKKMMMLTKAQSTIMGSLDKDRKPTSAVNALLENSFLGSLGSTILNMREALSKILMSDQPEIRAVIEKVLTPYIDKSDREFVKIAQKAVNDLFDWAVFNDKGYADLLKSEMIKDGGTAKQVFNFVRMVRDTYDHPLHNNHVIKILEYLPSPTEGSQMPNNLKVKGIDNKVFDQNNIIGAFREIRRFIQNESAAGNKEYDSIYKGLVNVAVLQSGLSSSPISFTSLLPYEDFAEIYNPTLIKLASIKNLENFYKLGVFQKNNWNNDTFVPGSRARWIKVNDPYGFGEKTSVYNPSMAFLPDDVKDAVSNGEIPEILTQSINNSDSKSDYVTFSWELQTELLTKEEMEAAIKGDDSIMSAVFAKKSAMRKANDYSYIKKGLFQKVYDNYGTPLTTEDKKGNKYYIYKAINAWGDSYRANEFYEVDKPSVFDNGMIKPIPGNNNLIIDIFKGTRPVVGAVTATSSSSVKTNVSLKGIFNGLNEFTLEQKSKILSNFAIKYGLTTEQALKDINAALEIDRVGAIEQLKKCY